MCVHIPAEARRQPGLSFSEALTTSFEGKHLPGAWSSQLRLDRPASHPSNPPVSTSPFFLTEALWIELGYSCWQDEYLMTELSLSPFSLLMAMLGDRT